MLTTFIYYCYCVWCGKFSSGFCHSEFVYARMYKHVCGTERLMLTVFLCLFSTLLFETESLNEPGTHIFGKTNWPEIFWDTLVSMSPCLRL